MSAKKKNMIFSAIYIIIFLLIMFSGSTFLSDYVMYLVIFLVLSLFCGAKIHGIDKFAFTFKGEKLIKRVFLLIIMFLIIQMLFTYDKGTTLVFIERFVAFFFLFIFIPKAELVYKTLKSIRIYSFIVAFSIIITTIINGTKSGGLVGNFQFAGMMMSISFGLLLIDYYFEKGKFDILGLIITFVALLCSGKRMFSFLALFSYFLIFLLSRNSKKVKKLFILTILSILALVVAYLFIPNVRLVTDRITQFQGDTTYNGRSYFWNAAIDIYDKHKFIGIGMGTFSKYFDINYHRLGNMEAYDAHNIYIQMLAELGIIGEGLFILFFIISLIKTVNAYKSKQLKNSNMKSYILAYSLYIQFWFIIYGLTGNPLYGASQFFFYITAIAMMFSVKYDNTN